jgi:hypothetical protein
MTSPIDTLDAAVSALREAWDAAAPAGADERAMTDAGLLAAHERLAAVRRAIDALHTRVAAELAVRSRPERGREGLARRAGHRTPARLIAATTGAHPGDAARLIAVGDATRERMTLSGEAAPPAHPHIADAVRAGAISVAAAAAIAGMLDRIALRVPAPTRAEAEAVVVARAPGLGLDELTAILRRVEAHLDPDGLEPAIAELHGERSLKIRHDARGMVCIDGRFDPETAAPIVAALEGIVTHQLRVHRGHHTPDGTAVSDARSATPHADAPHADGSNAGSTTGALPAGLVAAEPVGAETRSLAQLRADALAALCRHALACDETDLPLASTTVVVRMSLEALRSGTGVATIDGIEQPIDAGTARRMAAAAEIIPCVLGGESEVLDLGRSRRHFTRAQRLALVERDGGCAFCHLPPQYAEAHHILWWLRDGGPTDLSNGVLLCTGCHHRVHDDGWEIRIETPPGAPPSSGTVWFLPPACIDPARRPRMGGRRRFDPLTWRMAA